VIGVLRVELASRVRATGLIGVTLFTGSNQPCRAQAQPVSVAGWQVTGKRSPDLPRLPIAAAMGSARVQPLLDAPCSVSQYTA
jgi:hypothetical protein